jgi:hypothetical protein
VCHVPHSNNVTAVTSCLSVTIESYEPLLQRCIIVMMTRTRDACCDKVLAENDDDQIDRIVRDVFSNDSDIDDILSGVLMMLIIRGRVMWWLQRTLMYRK